MMIERIDQLVFGYEEGHRMLGGSTEIPAASLAILLGATDAPVESSKDRLVTGLPIDEIARYALCFTWSAPESPRPGAVWSHVLLVKPQYFELSASVSLLRELARKPELSDLEHYNTHLSCGSEKASIKAASLSLVEAIVTAVYGEGEPVVVHENLAESEQALFAVWEAQWPQLRSRFEFRTRESVRMSSPGGVVVARRVRGMTRQRESPKRDAWVTQLTDSIATQRALPIRRFLGTFGPTDSPEASTVSALARLYYHVESENCTAVRDVLESRYPDRRSGRELKKQLFGRPRGSWWAVSEASRLGAILGASVDAWELDGLDLERRLGDWIQQNGARQLIQDLIQGGPESIREAFLKALLRSGKASDVAPLVRSHPGLAAKWLVEQPAVGWEPDAWRGLDHDQAEAILTALGSPDSNSVLAATIAGHARAAIEVSGLSTALLSAARARNFAAATALIKASTWTNAAKVAAENAEIALLLGAISGGHSVPELGAALEARRDDVDGTWLKAAAVAISQPDPPLGSILEIVFGPLHHAITDDRLPSECWDFLNRVLPEAPDPALRLRRFLVRVAKEEGWRQNNFRRALRGAGPYATELYREFDDEDLLLGRSSKFIEWL